MFYLGLAIILSPFFAMTFYMIREGGWMMALKVWGIVAVIYGVLGFGVHLMRL